MKSGKCHHVLGQGASRFELDLAAYPVTELIDRHQLVLLRISTLNIGWYFTKFNQCLHLEKMSVIIIFLQLVNGLLYQIFIQIYLL